MSSTAFLGSAPQERDRLLRRQIGGQLLSFEDRTSRWHLLADREADDPLVIAGGLDDVLGVLADRPHAGCRNVPPAIRLDVRDDRDQRGGSLVESRRERRPTLRSRTARPRGAFFADAGVTSTGRGLHQNGWCRTVDARVISGFRRGNPIEAPRPAAAIPPCIAGPGEGRQQFVPLPTTSARVDLRREVHARPGPRLCTFAERSKQHHTRSKPHERSGAGARDPGGLRTG